MELITVWERFSEKHKTWVHNHIENGHTLADTPTAHTKYQERCWKDGIWKAYNTHLTDDNVVVL